ncbi:Sec-independent protein translocase subunit TatA [Actinoallomurus acaciae]|uniref:Sec-independent protein translocase protein TatA n=1 Tax=Actinoallomurus acaciae TaxID=502577 RepID=A0ABV5YBH4_9ACTN
MGELAPWHWLIVGLVFVLLFGAGRLPTAARSLGRSLRIFKTEMNGMRRDDLQATALEEPEVAHRPDPARPDA